MCSILGSIAVEAWALDFKSVFGDIRTLLPTVWSAKQHWHSLAAERNLEFQLQPRATKPKFVIQVDPWVIHIFIQV